MSVHRISGITFSVLIFAQKFFSNENCREYLEPTLSYLCLHHTLRMCIVTSSMIGLTYLIRTNISSRTIDNQEIAISNGVSD